MKIKQYKEFKKEFVFPGILEEKALLEKVKDNTFLVAVSATCKGNISRLTNSNRPKSDKDTTILLSYILYVCNFTSGLYENFDTICQWLVNDEYTYVDEVTIKETLLR